MAKIGQNFPVLPFSVDRKQFLACPAWVYWTGKRSSQYTSSVQKISFSRMETFFQAEWN